MSVPLFANSWYGKLPPDEVRKEVQNLYLLLGLVLEAAEVTVPTPTTPTTGSLYAGDTVGFAGDTVGLAGTGV